MPSEVSQLIVQLQGNIVQTVPLAMSVLTIGRTPDNGLVLPASLVSRHHAELRIEPEGPVLTDLGSSNGTFVAGTRLLANQPRLLTEGTVFQIGPFVLTYQAMEQPSQTVALEPLVEAGALVEPTPPVQEPVLAEAVQPASPTVPRSRWPMPLAQAPCSRYLSDLPIIFHDNEFLGRFLLIFETIWEPLEQRQDHIAMYFDPRTCPAPFLPWLASWLDLSFNAHWPEARRRALLAEAMDLYRWRGTRYGLARMIEVCTGLTPEIAEEPSQPFVFKISMTLPPQSGVERELIEELVRVHKPAHAGYVLELR